MALKEGWTWATFGDVVKLGAERSTNPAKDGFERYVGLDHIDPGDLKIRRWGAISNGTTFTSVFRPGQVLFGKRRAYQRKVAVADFSGVCSGDIYVFEPKNAHLLAELLPFLCQTGGFFEHAVATSAGSLSPRTNWNSLASYEFALPPLDEQRRIARVLWGIDKVRIGYAALQTAIQAVQASLLRELDPAHHSDRSAAVQWNEVSLDNAVSRIIDYRGRTPNKMADGVPLLTAKNIRRGYLNQEPAEFIAPSDFDEWMTRGLPELGDLLFTTEAPLGNVAEVPAYRFAIAQRLVILRANEGVVLPRYLYWALQSSVARREIRSRATGSTAKGISQAALRKVRLLLPSRDWQAQVVAKLDMVAAGIDSGHQRIANLRAVADAGLRGTL